MSTRKLTLIFLLVCLSSCFRSKKNDKLDQIPNPPILTHAKPYLFTDKVDLIDSLLRTISQNKGEIYSPTIRCKDTSIIKKHLNSRVKIQVGMTTVEYGPYAVGGVGSVVNTLSPMLAKYLQQNKSNNLNLNLIVPFYQKGKELKDKPEEYCHITHIFNYTQVTSQVLKGLSRYKVGNQDILIPTFYIKPDEKYDFLFDIPSPGAVYATTEHSDTLNRSLYFASAVSAFTQVGAVNEEGDPISILHHHSIYPAIANLILKNSKLESIPKLITNLHNLNWDQGQIETYSCEIRPCNLMRATMQYSDNIFTVSKTMIDEGRSLDPSLSYGLSDIYQKFFQAGKIDAIPNGIQYEAYDPQKILGDYNFDLNKTEVMDSKWRIKKEYLQEKSFIHDAQKPLFVFVGRYSLEKGVDLLRKAALTITENGGSLIVMGVRGFVGDHYVDALRNIFANDPNIYVMKGDPKLEQNNPEKTGMLVRAAADFVIVPSYEESFGLVPIEFFSMGAIAITSQVGGMKDYLQELQLKKLDLGNSVNYENYRYIDAYPNTKFSMRETAIESVIIKAINYYKSESKQSRSQVAKRLILENIRFDWLSDGGPIEILNKKYLEIADRSKL